MKSQPTVEQTDYSSKEADEEQHNREMKSGNQDNADPDPIPKYGNNFTAGVFSYFLSVLISGLKKSQKQQQLSPMLTFIVFIGKTRAPNTPETQVSGCEKMDAPIGPEPLFFVGLRHVLGKLELWAEEQLT